MFVPEKDSKGNIVWRLLPFASKSVETGKIYRRKHGVLNENTPAGESNFDFIVPYDTAKINKLEIIGGETGDTIDLKVFDTPTGTISGTANLLLNQFGFDVGVSKNFYIDESEYDADLIKDLKIRAVFNNRGTVDKTVVVNFNLHEVK